MSRLRTACEQAHLLIKAKAEARRFAPNSTNQPNLLTVNLQDHAEPQEENLDWILKNTVKALENE